jgi:hypothetical protein
MYVPFLMKYMGVLMLAVFIMLDLIICYKRMSKIVSVCAKAQLHHILRWGVYHPIQVIFYFLIGISLIPKMKVQLHHNFHDTYKNES